MPLCRVPEKRHSANTHFAECQKMALGKIHLCRVPEKSHSVKTHFTECRKMALGKIHPCRVPKKNTRQSHLCRVFFLSSVFYLALGKDRLYRMFDKIHLTEPSALGKVSVSGSACNLKCKVLLPIASLGNY